MLRSKIFWLSICTYISRCTWICTWFYIYICICQSKISSTTRVSVSLHFSSFIYCWLNYHCFNHSFSKMLLHRRAFNHQLPHTTKSSCLRETSQLSYFQPNQSKETSRFWNFLSWNNFQIFHPVLFLKLKLKQLFQSQSLKPMPHNQVCWSCCYRQLHWCHFGGGSRLVLWGFSTEIFVFFFKRNI